MPEAGAEAKSPKTTRRLRTTGSQTPPRQVRFDDSSPKRSTASIASGNPVAEGNRDCSFPALPGTAWYTATDPTRSISGQQPTHVNNVNPQPPHYYLHHNHLPHHSVTFIGHQQQQHPVNMADYANTAPPPMGVNFQPPVPDTTFGPIPHLYVPRFDPPPQVGLPSSVHYLPFVAPCPAPRMGPSAATFSVLVPRTFHSAGYPYYASANQYSLSFSSETASLSLSAL